jgi:hypothetical protein
VIDPRSWQRIAWRMKRIEEVMSCMSRRSRLLLNESRTLSNIPL